MRKRTALLASIVTASIFAYLAPQNETGWLGQSGAKTRVAGATSVARGPYLQLARPTSVVVKWRTDEPAQSRVFYGVTPDNLEMNRGNAMLSLDHEVLVDGLEPETRYYYAIADENAVLSGGDSSFFFVTAPVAGKAVPARIWALGDSGTADANAAAVRDAYTAFTAYRPTSLWLMLGDNAYERGTDFQYQEALFETYPIWLRQVPLWPTLGNHDADSADSATQTGPYFDIFTLPAGGEAGGLASGTEAYYSFDYGNIHFICLDSSDSGNFPVDPMARWLLSDLVQNDQEWTIAYWHHPPYSKGSHDSDTEGRLVQMRENILPILETWGVDLVLSGHSHAYERSFLLDGHYGDSSSLKSSMILDDGDGQEDGTGAYLKLLGSGAPHEGTVYVVAGSGGKLRGGPFDHPAMLVALRERGSLVLDIYGSRLDALFLNVEGAVRDHFTLLKGSDLLPPVAISARATQETKVDVLFAEPLDTLNSVDTSRYAIDRGVVIHAAQLESDGRTVTLTTSSLRRGLTYVLTVTGIADRAGNQITAQSVPFDFVIPEAQEFQNGLLPTPTYTGTRDTYIARGSPDENFGDLSKVRGDGSPELRPLLFWDLSSIPSGVRVESATITIDLENDSSGIYELFEIRRDWSEAEVTWQQFSAGQPWAAPGADSPQDRGQQVVSRIAPDQTGVRTFPLNSAGLELIQDWIDGRKTNWGFLLSSRDTTDGIVFKSSENEEISRRPKLKIDYAVPAANPELEVHIAGIDMGLIRKGTQVQATARVTIGDGTDQPVAGATVFAQWDGLAGGSASGITRADGTVLLNSSWVSLGDRWPSLRVPTSRFVVTVTEVQASGRVYNPSANQVSVGCIDYLGRSCG